MTIRLVRGVDWPQVLPTKEMPPLGTRTPRKTFKQRRPGNDPAHLTAIRKLSCSVCPETRYIDAHHLKHAAAAAYRSFGKRAPDMMSCPVCRYHHDEIEKLGSRREHEFWDDRCLDAHALAARLWRESPNVERMARTVAEFKQTAIRMQSAFLRQQAQVNALMRHGLTKAEAEEQYAAGLKGGART